jgi:hypothetical protein
MRPHKGDWYQGRSRIHTGLTENLSYHLCIPKEAGSMTYLAICKQIGLF